MSERAGPLTAGSASEAGILQEGLDRAGALLQAAVEANFIGAASLTVARNGILVCRKGFGRRSPDPDAPAVDGDSVFLLAPITKPVTVCALMLLVEQGLVSLGDKVSRYLPEYIGGERDEVLVSHLLSHTSGMPDMLPQNKELRQAHAPMSAFVEGALCTPLLYTPNTDMRYQSMGTLLAAEIVERITAMPLRDFQEQEIFGLLGMNSSALGMGRFASDDTVWYGLTKPETGDAARWGQNSSYWRNVGCPWGGMHSTGGDLAVLLQTMLNLGEYNGRRLLSRATVQAMTTNRNKPGLGEWGLGWAVGGSIVWNFFTELATPSVFGHVGSTGTVAWADPERQLSCVVLTNQYVENGSLLRRVSNVVSASVIE